MAKGKTHDQWPSQKQGEQQKVECEATQENPQEAEPVQQAAISAPIPTLSKMNAYKIDKIVREFRESVLYWQQKRGDGRIAIEAFMADGTICGKAAVNKKLEIQL